jgi:DNA-binding NtrC family response regulator
MTDMRTKEKPKEPERALPRRQPSLVLVFECDRPLAGGLSLPLAGELLIGRGAPRQLDGDTLRVPDGLMSSRHARLSPRGARFAIEDLGSKNGTVVNGVTTAAANLRDGDVLELGQSFFLYREQQVAAGGYDDDPQPLLATRRLDYASALVDLGAVAPTPVSVLLLGETGTGKEVLARAVHDASARRGPFVAVNCGALPATLIESELFGYKKGAFSGAAEDRAGLVRSADGGTLFLDEIGDLPLPSQAALLRVLQEREVTPLGATRPVKVDIRVIAATHRDLRKLADKEQFRADLLQRLAGFTVSLPPLRERREDLGDLCAGFLKQALGEDSELRLAPEAARRLLAYAWPGNLRELGQSLSTAALLARRGTIEVLHLPESLREAAPPAPPPPPPELTPEQMEHRDQLEALLREHSGNVTAVAKVLGKTRMQVHRWMSRYGIDPDSFRPA